MRGATTQRLRKLASLDGGDLLHLLAAQRALVAGQLLVWTRPVGKLTAPAEEGAAAAPLAAADEALAKRIALAVGRAAENGIFRPRCLVRAVAIQRMLEARGISGGRICIGVRRRGGRFAAHAWVQRGDLLLGDVETHVNTFVPLTDVELLPPS
ncbi:MAG: lasso peptide biosynthesis B2 protein [Gemmatimonadota bacterium]|nr:lasso peptide biosynthesis B2 protein [Gemmatimonadota bacterium]